MDDFAASVARVRVALIQSQVREKNGSTDRPVHRRRRSTVTAVCYSGTRDGVPVFTKQKITRVVM
ncbi:hypothetical protein VTK26DRAFT_3704 [Humicola hyalothermophila]